MRDDTHRSRRFAKVLRSHLTDAETILWSRLRDRQELGCVFRRQHPIGPYVADFACVRAKVVVELDGEQHGSQENHTHDQRRDAYMAARGWRVIRITNDRIYKELGAVLNMLADAIPPPSPVGATSPAISRSSGEGVEAPRGRKE